MLILFIKNILHKEKIMKHSKQNKFLITMIATMCGAGLIKKAPGTFGSLTAFPVAYILYALELSNLHIVTVATITALIFYFIGVWAANKFDKMHKTHDSKQIVIDEFVGQIIAMLPVFWLFSEVNYMAWLLSFILFRIFDILKPPPIQQIDRLVKGGTGVMLDDVVAGILAAIGFMAIYQTSLLYGWGII